MALVLILGLYALALFALGLASRLDMSNEARLVFGIVGGIGALVIPLFVYSVIDSKLTRSSVNRIGRSWCENGHVDFLRVEEHKNHFVVVFRDDSTAKPRRQKFRVRFVPTRWTVKAVEWL